MGNKKHKSIEEIEVEIYPKNYEIPDELLKEFAHAIYPGVGEYFNYPENRRCCEDWKKEQEENKM